MRRFSNRVAKTHDWRALKMVSHDSPVSISGLRAGLSGLGGGSQLLCILLHQSLSSCLQILALTHTLRLELPILYSVRTGVEIAGCEEHLVRAFHH